MIELNAKPCTNGKLGTGLAACEVELGFPLGFIRTNRSWSESIASGTLDKDYFIKEVQKMNFVPFIGSADYESNTAEATQQESANGLTRVVRNGKPQMSFTYWRGFPFHTIASSYNSYGEGNVILVFEQGLLVVESVDGETISGFKLGMQNTGTFSFNDGSNGEQVMVSIQLANENEFNLRGQILTNDSLGFNVATELPSVIDCDVKLDTPSAGSSISASVVATSNSAFNILGLEVANFRVIVNGTAEAPSAVSYNDVTEKYDITTTTSITSSDTVTLELYDSVEDLNVTILDDQLYRGKSTEQTVA